MGDAALDSCVPLHHRDVRLVGVGVQLHHGALPAALENAGRHLGAARVRRLAEVAVQQLDLLRRQRAAARPSSAQRSSRCPRAHDPCRSSRAPPARLAAGITTRNISPATVPRGATCRGCPSRRRSRSVMIAKRRSPSRRPTGRMGQTDRCRVSGDDVTVSAHERVAPRARQRKQADMRGHCDRQAQVTRHQSPVHTA